MLYVGVSAVNQYYIVLFNSANHFFYSDNILVYLMSPSLGEYTIAQQNTLFVNVVGIIILKIGPNK